jgi:hypothetical protein
MVTASNDPSSERAAAKSALLQAIAAQPQRSAGLPEPAATVERFAAALEALNPIPSPTTAPEQLTGNWRTLYTTSNELLKIGAAIPGFRSNGIYQCIWAARGLLCNVAQIDGLTGLGGIVAVRATFTAVSPQRVQVRFTQAFLGSQVLMNFELDSFLALMEDNPNQIPALKLSFSPTREQKGWLDVTYLDETLRIGRGNEGSLFVLEKVTPIGSARSPELG